MKQITWRWRHSESFNAVSIVRKSWMEIDTPVGVFEVQLLRSDGVTFRVTVNIVIAGIGSLKQHFTGIRPAFGYIGTEVAERAAKRFAGAS